MAVVWPASIVPNDMQEAALGWPYDVQRSPSGSGSQKQAMQQRWQVTFGFPRLDTERGNLAKRALAQSAGQGGLIVPLPTTVINAPLVGGSTLVNAAWNDASGYNLQVKGILPSVAIPDNIWLSILTAGRWHLYLVALGAVAGQTARTLTMSSLALTAHQPNDPVAIQDPVIEGMVSAIQRGVDVSRLSTVSAFTVSPL